MGYRRDAAWAFHSVGPVIAAIPLLAGFSLAHAQAVLTYQRAPAAIEALLDAPLTPVVHVAPDRSALLVEQPQSYPTIADVAQPRYRLAGLRFNPATNGPSREVATVRMWLQAVEGGDPRPIAGLPSNLRASRAVWSPDSRHVAFVQRVIGPDARLELWIVDVGPARAHRLDSRRLNAVLGAPCAWLPDSSGLLCKIVPGKRGPVPRVSDVPAGPNVEENLGKLTPARTYEDLLKTPADEAIFEYYAASELALLRLHGPAPPLPVPVSGLITFARPSPDGRFALTETLHRPFSYALPAENFPARVAVIALPSGTATELSDHPLLDSIPIGFDAVAAGPRDYAWRSDAPSTVVWVEAGDGGDPKVAVTVRDRLLQLKAPFVGAGETLLESPLRLRGVEWGNGHLAVATESRWSDRKLILLSFDPERPGGAHVTLYEGSSQDRYHSPGRPVTAPNTSGHPVLSLADGGNGIYFFSPGASEQGDLPFVGVMPVGGGAERIVWRSANETYQEPVSLLADDQVLIREESASVPPNYYVAALPQTPASPSRPLTRFASPYAGIDLPTKQLLKYRRADGVELTATLWLPAGYDRTRGPLPTLIEAYPAEFKTRSAAGQVSGSPYRFPRIGWGSPVFFTQTGYAVLESASIPIVGEGDAQPNDTYVEQLVAGAKAAIDEGAALGVVDAKRVAVMGHSYGAFMTANLLAHSDLFRAGIARSGAYNRTLTPFGFQAEERTYWEAPDVYYRMSPFSFADKIKTPLLLIHGEADDNQGTFPIQSERFYSALKGEGATVRLVWLPLEAHGYEARESIGHMLWEMNRWLDTYVKPEVPIASAMTAVKTRQADASSHLP
jgi:dipeptidyl aminopeptidase/acylaminoacyl peptidase